MSRIERRLGEIALRKQRLAARAQGERDAVAASFSGLEAPIAVVDQGLAIARFLRAHPVAVAAVVTVLVAFRRRGLLSLAGTAISVWRLWRSIAAPSRDRLA